MRWITNLKIGTRLASRILYYDPPDGDRQLFWVQEYK